MDDRMFDENIRRIRNDDKEGLRAIYEEYRTMIYSTVFDILHSREDSEDIASEFFIKLWNAAGSYRPGNGHRAWMITIARNMAKDFLRKHEHEVLTDEIPEDQETGTDAYREAESSLAYRQMVACLDPAEREVINLKFIGELTFREIAEQLGKPQGTVSWLYNKAIEKMKGAVK